MTDPLRSGLRCDSSKGGKPRLLMSARRLGGLLLLFDAQDLDHSGNPAEQADGPASIKHPDRKG